VRQGLEIAQSITTLHGGNKRITSQAIRETCLPLRVSALATDYKTVIFA